MKELRTILAKYQRAAQATLGNEHEEGPLAPNLGRDLEHGVARMRRRELVCYGAAGMLLVALLGTFLTQSAKEPLAGGALIAGMAWTLDYVRRLSRERDAMDLLLGFCRSEDDRTVAAIVSRMQRLHVPERHGPSLSFDDVGQLHDAAIRLHLDGERAALFGGIDPHVLGAIPTAGTSSAQLLMDLHELNRIGAAPDTDVPLRHWLENAIAMSRERLERTTFERCLRKLDGVAVNEA